MARLSQCKRPVTLPLRKGKDRVGQRVACGKCKGCIRDKVDMIVGQCLAEAQFSKLTLFLTLTYGKGAGYRAHDLTYIDVQRMLARIRKAKVKVRYFVAGEYGERKGRAHWHMLLFSETAALADLRLTEQDLNRQKFHWHFWPHGFTFIERMHGDGAARYVSKYAVKTYETMQAKTARSKHPPLGDRFYRHIAEEHAKAGHFLRKWMYKPSGGRKLPDGRAYEYPMTEAVRRYFVKYWREAWARHQPGRPRPISEELDWFEDGEAREQANRDPHEIERYLHRKYGVARKVREAISTDCGRGVVVKHDDGSVWLYKEEEPFSVRDEIEMRRNGATRAQLIANRRAKAKWSCVLVGDEAIEKALSGDWTCKADLWANPIGDDPEALKDWITDKYGNPLRKRRRRKGGGRGRKVKLTPPPIAAE